MGDRRTTRFGIQLSAAVFALFAFDPRLAGGQQSIHAPSSFAELLKQLSPAPATACDSPRPGFSDLELRLFRQADRVLTLSLNENAASKAVVVPPSAVATAALEELERLSGETNQNWPGENRFHFEVFDIPPALVVKMTFRSRATFSFFASFRGRHGKNSVVRWQTVGASNDRRLQPGGMGNESLDIYPLARGPSRRPRFLAVFRLVGCAAAWE